MMIILSKSEYNDLVQKASNIEGEVERRCEQFRENLMARLKSKFVTDVCEPYPRTVEERLRQFVAEIER